MFPVALKILEMSLKEREESVKHYTHKGLVEKTFLCLNFHILAALSKLVEGRQGEFCFQCIRIACVIP